MNYFKVLGLCVTIFIFYSCSEDNDLFDPDAVRNPPNISTPTSFADANVNQETRDLYEQLLEITQQGISFGQQVPFGTGNTFPVADELEEDFFEVTGDHPAIAGFDLELIGLRAGVNAPNTSSLDDYIDRFVADVRAAHENGSIITISWHMVSPNDFGQGGDGTFDNIVPQMLEGGTQRAFFIGRLERAARLFNRLVDAQGRSIPVLFRPWHEMNGDFFFWGEGFRTTEEYVQLWRDTVRILSNDLEVHNLLYVYAPNWVSTPEEYLRNYPDDEFVDMLGIDVYDFRNGNFLNSALTNINIVETIALDRNMLFALTETGLENVVQDDWWTQNLYRAIRSSSMTYAMIWRNDMTTFFHAPFLGHSSMANFNEFLDKEDILLSSDI